LCSREDENDVGGTYVVDAEDCDDAEEDREVGKELLAVISEAKETNRLNSDQKEPELPTNLMGELRFLVVDLFVEPKIFFGLTCK